MARRKPMFRPDRAWQRWLGSGAGRRLAGVVERSDVCISCLL